jgi:hypothetical protein
MLQDINGRVTKSVDIDSNLYISMEMHEYVSPFLAKKMVAAMLSTGPFSSAGLAL